MVLFSKLTERIYINVIKYLNATIGIDSDARYIKSTVDGIAVSGLRPRLFGTGFPIVLERGFSIDDKQIRKKKI